MIATPMPIRPVSSKSPFPPFHCEYKCRMRLKGGNQRLSGKERRGIVTANQANGHHVVRQADDDSAEDGDDEAVEARYQESHAQSITTLPAPNTPCAHFRISTPRLRRCLMIPGPSRTWPSSSATKCATLSRRRHFTSAPSRATPGELRPSPPSRRAHTHEGGSGGVLKERSVGDIIDTFACSLPREVA
jgi:hypothetical protein